MLTLENLETWLTLFDEKIHQHRDYLSELDTAIGDGDHGNNMVRGTEAVMAALQEKQPETVADMLKLVAMSLIGKVGGASGPLYGTAFLEMAKIANSTDNLAELLQAGLEGIQKRGKAVPQDKTMVDVWFPVVEAAKADALTEQTIWDAAEATKPLVAKKGRASYLGERSAGHLDPGAVSSAYLFSALLEAGAVQ
ncbi:dihydroxyacetone kinase subunit DhaL [Vagococcus acidifermentans]|uniref:phosphoenolpyruvate--glycerone phosphotransferase n=1 Tax=Vagococcus acidifermentans TaxID=564710 RepID=A0A430AQ13_9ENTE|nr:dihydroxyacetone kinase subunit DhaL [Vagococcus acidifermentans]RSU10222.1 dihydroxyacetone kinase subunit L [Vagococcus acidifermentans]